MLMNEYVRYEVKSLNNGDKQNKANNNKHKGFYLNIRILLIRMKRLWDLGLLDGH